ncbi:hypothetical protein PHMEG_00010708 [Phytophthora megakarya]|uniref:Ubiquitin-like protease family profile domain-containing protein n=1 Tax=Phytophthora megakarya TaxID=4795 RepID=A0A225WFH8_9STRA|nr:hypothetical protein PHMEG_00010708 [Phytophthora megakarya]
MLTTKNLLRCIVHVDSLGVTSTDTVKKIVGGYFDTELKTKYPQRNVSRFKSRAIRTSPMQTNTDDCGGFVLFSSNALQKNSIEETHYFSATFAISAPVQDLRASLRTCVKHTIIVCVYVVDLTIAGSHLSSITDLMTHLSGTYIPDLLEKFQLRDGNITPTPQAKSVVLDKEETLTPEQIAAQPDALEGISASIKVLERNVGVWHRV